MEQQLTEGEQVIGEYLDEASITYKTQISLPHLEGDTKSNRVVDFYLTDYHVYIEFFGKWSTGGIDEYKQKRDIYSKNKIPCIYLWPENLGALNYIFKRRLVKVLKENNMKKELFNFRSSLYIYEYRWSLLACAVLIYLFVGVVSSGVIILKNIILYSFLLAIFGYSPGKALFLTIWEYFKPDTKVELNTYKILK